MKTPMNPIDAPEILTPAQKIVRRVARFLMQPLALALALQPAAYAAPDPSLLSQLPRFTQASAASNVVFLMDDSLSMLNMQLPIPSGIVPASGGPWKFTLNRANPITGDAQSRLQTRDDWILRSPTLNPAYYNPAITYEPWNNDGHRMPPSDIKVIESTVPSSAGWREGFTGHDPRYSGANYTNSTEASRKPIHDIVVGRQGADALYVDEAGNTKTAFNGATPPAGLQQWDLFSRWAKKPTQACSAWDTSYIYAGYDAPLTCTTATSTATKEYSEVNCSTGGATGAWTTTNPGPTSCPASSETGFADVPAKTRFVCPAGATLFGTDSCCQTGDLIDPVPADTACSTAADSPIPCPCTAPSGPVSGCPAGQTCPVGNRWVVAPSEPVLAYYYRYDGPVGSVAGMGNPANYTMVEIERYDNDNADPAVKLQPSSQLFPVHTEDGQPVLASDTTIRPECTAVVGVTKACNWEQEAQNFANWYTYFRVRLFAAIAVTAEALSGLQAGNSLDSLRLGYGSLNYFHGSGDPYLWHPWFPNLVSPGFRTITDVDPIGQGGFAPRAQDTAGYVSNLGVITRGVRAFTQGTAAREQVFNWLFSLRAQGATPSREALDSVGRYFSRRDAWGPWSEFPGAVGGFDSRPVTQHMSCRRSYTILVTDGEWTNTPSVQPLIENRGAPPAWVSAQAGSTPLNAASHLDQPVFNDGPPEGPEFPPPSGAGYQQPQFSTVTGSPTGTLSDAAYYWWSRDLRPDIVNGVRPLLDGTVPQKRNESFWQNVTPFIVGYGLNASMDLLETRTAIADQTALTWPSVNTSQPGAGNPGIVKDEQCAGVLDAKGNFSGCGRVNDTFRAARAARGDFLVATDVQELARKVAEAFASISEVPGSATSITGERNTLSAGGNDLLYTAKFVTNRWSGSIEAFRAIDLNAATLSGAASPAPVAKTHYSGKRSGSQVFTSTGPIALGVSIDGLSDKSALGGDDVVDWVLGEQGKEFDAGGTLRSRAQGDILGDIVNSQPIFSRARNFGYSAARAPAASLLKNGGRVDDYLTYIRNTKSGRPATVFVGANDGMLHAFNAADLSETFAYIPRAVHGELAKLTEPGYLHQYYVDGPVVEGDVAFSEDKHWRTVIVGTNGAGPKGIFALDVTNPNAVSVLWDLAATDTRGNISSLGHITQPGVIGSGPDGRWYYFTGNGWESKDDKARLLAIDIQTGDIKAFETDEQGGPDPVGVYESTSNTDAQPNGLGGVTPVYDGGRNIVAIYAGDRHGRLWKFDLSGSTRGKLDDVGTLQAVAMRMFTATNGDGQRQPITAAPRLLPHPLGGRMVVFGSGRLTEDSDIGNTEVQSVYALWERNPALAATEVSRSQLHAFHLDEKVVDGEAVREITNLASINWHNAALQGWYIDLLVSNNKFGERVIASPIADAGFVKVASFEPVADGDKCKGGGASELYCFDIAGNFTRGCVVIGGVTQPPSVVAAGIPPTVSGLTSLKVKYPEAPLPTVPVTLDSTGGSLLGQTASPACETHGTGTGGGPGNGVFSNDIEGEKSGRAMGSEGCQGIRVWRDLPRQ